MAQGNSEQLESIYANSSDHVRRNGLDIQAAQKSYAHYVQYIEHFVDLKEKTVLDVGCGNGWSSFLISERAQMVTGMDVHRDNFEPELSQNLAYLQSSATQIKIPAETFDVVCTHECLEHVAQPQKALAELDRVLKPGGYLFIVGPNLLSVLQSVRGVLFYVWQNRPLRRILWRDKTMPHHPHGNTLPEIIFFFFYHLVGIFRLIVFKKPLFWMRQPDTQPPFHADNDACYYLNPLDLKYYFEERGYEILNDSGVGRRSFLALISSGTYFAAHKRL